jgi:prevent-host-death family protein
VIDLAQDIHSLTDFKRRTAKFVAQMKSTGHPLVLTVNGKAELVIQDAASYQRLMERAENAEMVEFLQQSREDIEAGRTVPMREAVENLGKKRK